MITTINNSEYHTFDVGLSDEQRNTLMTMIDDEITRDTVKAVRTKTILNNCENASTLK